MTGDIQLDLAHLIATYGYWVIGVAICLENFGLPVPGETVLLAAAAYAGNTHNINIWPVVTIAGLGGFIGACLGFGVGRGFGYRMLVRHGKRIGLTDIRIKIGEYLFLKHGPEIVLFSRFLSVFKIFVAPLAGANRMTWQRFLPYTFVGAFLWAGIYGAVAFRAGEFAHHYGAKIGIALTLAAVLFVIGTLFYANRHEAELAVKAEEAFPGPLRRRRRPRVQTNV